MLNASEQIYKILFLGQSGVGKSTIIHNFAEENFQQKSPTVGIDFKKKPIIIDNQTHTLQLWDTAGQQRYRNIVKNFFKNAHGAAVVFDLCTIASLKQCRYWFEVVKEECGKQLSKVLIGNKIDKFKNEQIQDQKAQLIMELIQEYKQKYGVVYYQCSGKTGENLKTPFIQLTKKVVKSFPKDSILNLGKTSKFHKKKTKCC